MTVGTSSTFPFIPLPDEMALPVLARTLGRKAEKLPLIHTFVKHLPCPEVPTGHVRLTGQSPNIAKGLGI